MFFTFHVEKSLSFVKIKEVLKVMEVYVDSYVLSPKCVCTVHMFVVTFSIMFLIMQPTRFWKFINASLEKSLNLVKMTKLMEKS